MSEPTDPSDFNEGGTYDGIPLLELAAGAPHLTPLEREQMRGYQEPGDLAVLSHLTDVPERPPLGS